MVQCNYNLKSDITQMSMTEQKWLLYRTENLVNGKIYVGVHKLADTSTSRRYLGSGYALKSAIKLYGRENFIRTPLAEFSCAEEAFSAEAEIVNEEFINRPDTYNMKNGGIGGVGYSHTDEAKEKIRAATKGNTNMLGKTHGAETRARMSVASKGNKRSIGRVLSEEAKAKISAANKGRVRSEETRKKIGDASRGNKYSVGRVLSDETKAKMSAKAKGRVVSEETRIKISEGLKGRVFNEETKAKLTGAENHKSLAIVINDKYYESINVAAKSEGIKGGTIRRRVLSTTGNFDDYRFATLEEKAAHSSRQSI